MARVVDVYATLLDDQGKRERLFLRFRPYDGRFEELRDLDDLGEITPLRGGLVGTGSSTCRCHCKDAALPEWLKRLMWRQKENT